MLFNVNDINISLSTLQSQFVNIVQFNCGSAEQSSSALFHNYELLSCNYKNNFIIMKWIKELQDMFSSSLDLFL